MINRSLKPKERVLFQFGSNFELLCLPTTTVGAWLCSVYQLQASFNNPFVYPKSLPVLGILTTRFAQEDPKQMTLKAEDISLLVCHLALRYGFVRRGAA